LNESHALLATSPQLQFHEGIAFHVRQLGSGSGGFALHFMGSDDLGHHHGLSADQVGTKEGIKPGRAN
jgi:hypothetical protein